MNNKTIHRIACPVMALFMILGNSGHTQAATTVTQTTSPSIYWGAMVDGKIPSSTNMQQGGVFDTFETRSKKKMAIIHFGESWIIADGSWGEFQTGWFDNVRNHGSIPMLTWASQKLGYGTNQPDFQLRDVYEGKYDTYIQRWASAAKSWGHPFFLRFDAEMNGWWLPWGEGKLSNGEIVNGNSAGDFVKAWRHVHDIFTAVGATNVTWVWAPNIIGAESRYPALSSLYPGDSYVDWTGLSVYNKYSVWLGLNPLLTGSGLTWLKNSYNEVLTVAPNKAMMLAEWASIEAGDGGAKKAAWITDALTVQIPTNFPKIKAVVWFNWQQTAGETFPIESSQAATDAWAANIGSAVYAKNQYANLNTSPIPPLGGSTTTTFSDVSTAHPYYNDIETLYANGLTGGCSTTPLMYCPDQIMDRGQAAVFMVRGTYSSGYVPNPAANLFQDDWSRGTWAQPWAEAMRETGLTGGCKTSPWLYCPWDQLPREQLVIFGLRMKYGNSYLPPAATGRVFADLTDPNYYASAWAEKAYSDGLIQACGTSGGKPKFCPTALVTRGLGAYVIVRAKNLSKP